MKLSAVKDLLKSAIKEGVEINLDEIDIEKVSEGINSFANNVVKAKVEETKETSRIEVLKDLGFEDEKELKEELEKAKKAEETESEQIKTLQEELENTKSQLNEKEEVLTKQERLSILSNHKIKEDKLNKAYNLVLSELEEGQEFEEAVKKFAEETPEWLDGKPSIEIGDEGSGDGDDNEDDGKKIADAWG